MERARTLDASPGSRANARIWALLRHVQGRVDAKVNLHYSDLATRFDAREQVSGIVTPTLIVQGHDDELTPPIHGLHLCRRIERARYHEFLSVGHFMPLHRHHSFNKCLRDFLRNPGRMTSGPTPSAVVRPRSRPESTRHD